MEKSKEQSLSSLNLKQTGELFPEQHDDLDDDVFVGGYLTCCGSLRFFIKNACTDIGRHKCQFFLAYCSVFIVVLSVIVVNAVIAKGPLIFLQLAENQDGAFDGFFKHNLDSYSDYSSNSKHNYNYTHIYQLYGDTYNLSPREQFQDISANYSSEGYPELKGFKGTIVFMDTIRENQINLGNDWPFDPLAEGECLASSAFQSTYKVEKNETVYFNYTIDSKLDNIRTYYNVLAD